MQRNDRTEEEEEEKKEYLKLLLQIKETPLGKESRKLHKKLKKFGDGLDFNRRYPNFSLGFSIATLIISILTLIFRCLR